MKTYFDNYTQEELEQIIKLSTSYKDFARKIGYSNSPSGDTLKNIKKKCQELSLDTSHFTSIQNSDKIERSKENIFIKDSTVSQKTLRKWYEKGNYSQYECAICHREPVWENQPLVLILDHINGINNDDRLENLRWVCPNCNSQLETTGSRNPNRKIFAKKYYCKDCGKEIFRGAVRCIECNAKFHTVPLEKMPVTREELKNLIRTKPMTKVGEQFGVTDNSIRKWCIKFGLPTKKTEINNYSDEEWLNI